MGKKTAETTPPPLNNSQSSGSIRRFVIGAPARR
jgi:hypothetical protein